MSKSSAPLLKNPALQAGLKQLDADGWVRPAVQKRAEDTRDRLIEAAEDVFAEKGYTGARINDIAARADVSPASVYVRFKDKDGLFNAVLDRFRDNAKAILDHFLDGPSLNDVDTETVIHAIVLDNAVKFQQHAGIIRATLQRGMSEPETMARFLNLRQTLIDRVSDFVAKRSPNEQPSAIQARVAEMFDVIYGTLVMRLSFRGDRSDPQDFVALLADMVIPNILDTNKK